MIKKFRRNKKRPHKQASAQGRLAGLLHPAAAQKEGILDSSSSDESSSSNSASASFLMTAAISSHGPL